jgi:hypothetical protein
MNYFFKHILLYFFISIIVIIVFTIYLKFLVIRVAVGMAPFLIAVNLYLQLGNLFNTFNCKKFNVRFRF